uniref:Csu868(Trp) n=1 Tax=Arundo donax TaxID=35708 RepID=A0A0A9FFY2_ARUDO
MPPASARAVEAWMTGPSA